MIVVISPSKTQDFEVPVRGECSQPLFWHESKILLEELRKLSREEIGKLMEISDKLADLNFNRFRNFSPFFDENNSKQAFLAFRGDVYDGLKADEFSPEDQYFAQNHLRILSGFYGLLRPNDLIQPYRLEMKTALKNPRGKNLYEFWGEKLKVYLEKEISVFDEKVLVNLASEEYAKALHLKKFAHRVITPVFKEDKGGKYSVVALFAKKARGMMANFIIKNRITIPENIKAFQESGYLYAEKLSDANEWVFVR